MTQLYLAGPFKHDPGWDYKREQREVLERNGFVVSDPTVENGDFRALDPFEFETARQIVEGDVEIILKCDGMVVNTFQRSFGTAMEAAYAKLAGKKVILVTHGRKDMVSPWLVYHADIIIEKVDDESAQEIARLFKSGSGRSIRFSLAGD
jgi:nucleoside 2-deoxyribosyltransferase